jgi:hypothetical protein
MPTVHLLDYVAGNIRSLVNAINQVGYEVEWIKSPEDVKNADVRELLSLSGRQSAYSLLTIFYMAEIDSPWRRPLWTLPFTTRQRRLPRPNPGTH